MNGSWFAPPASIIEWARTQDWPLPDWLDARFPAPLPAPLPTPTHEPEQAAAPRQWKPGDDALPNGTLLTTNERAVLEILYAHETITGPCILQLLADQNINIDVPRLTSELIPSLRNAGFKILSRRGRNSPGYKLQIDRLIPSNSV